MALCPLGLCQEPRWEEDRWLPGGDSTGPLGSRGQGRAWTPGEGGGGGVAAGGSEVEGGRSFTHPGGPEPSAAAQVLAEEAPSPPVTSQLHNKSPLAWLCCQQGRQIGFAGCSQDQPIRGPGFRHHQGNPALQRGPVWPLRTRAGRKQWKGSCPFPPSKCNDSYDLSLSLMYRFKSHLVGTVPEGLGSSALWTPTGIGSRTSIRAEVFPSQPHGNDTPEKTVLFL